MSFLEISAPSRDVAPEFSQTPDRSLQRLRFDFFKEIGFWVMPPVRRVAVPSSLILHERQPAPIFRRKISRHPTPHLDRDLNFRRKFVLPRRIHPGISGNLTPPAPCPATRSAGAGSLRRAAGKNQPGFPLKIADQIAADVARSATLQTAKPIPRAGARVSGAADLRTGHDGARRLPTAMVRTNTRMDGFAELCFGGLTQTGHGRDRGRSGLEEFMQGKTLVMRIGQSRAKRRRG